MSDTGRPFRFPSSPHPARVDAGHAPTGDEYSMSSMRCSLTQIRAGGCAVARNEHSGTAACTGSPYWLRWVRLCMSRSLIVQEVSPMQKPAPFAALIGIDWADRKHDVCLCAAGSTKRERSVIAHTPAALRDWADKLRAR